jgi:DNA-binding transcriptional MerR regulator/anti-sigma regulatory factor (Ser/Thr protein kinase)
MSWSTMPFPVRQPFACSPASAGAARTFVIQALTSMDVDLDVVSLLVSELAANAIRHAGTPFEVTVREVDDGVRIEVSDQSNAELKPGVVADEGGFGLGIVGALSRSWGVAPSADGKVVWFEVAAAVKVGVGVPVAGAGWPSEERPTYSIGAVAAMLGVEASTLRAWEQRYGVVKPPRTPGGHRLYSRDHVDQLRFVVAQMAQGMAAPDAHRLLQQRAEEVTFVPEDPSISMLVLVAERDVYAAELSEYFLRTEGYDVRVALDGDEARRLQRERRPDLVVLELLLPGSSAIELCRDLAAQDIPVLAVSSLAMRDVAVDAGASAFLIKPLDPLQLISTVRDLTGTSAYATTTADKAQRGTTTR